MSDINTRDKTESRIFETIEIALARAGFRILDGDRNTVIIREPKEDRDFQIKLEEIPG